MTQIIETQPEHLPELALSSTQPSISSATALEDRSAPSSTKTEKGPKTPSANRLSISYARGNRRLVLDAEVVESLKLYRQEGRIDVVIKLAQGGDERLKGILVRWFRDFQFGYNSQPFFFTDGRPVGGHKILLTSLRSSSWFWSFRTSLLEDFCSVYTSPYCLSWHRPTFVGTKMGQNWRHSRLAEEYSWPDVLGCWWCSWRVGEENPGCWSWSGLFKIIFSSSFESDAIVVATDNLDGSRRLVY